MEFLLDINLWSAFLTLTVLEIVLGIDNIIFLTLMVNRLPEHQRPMARQIGLLGAMGARILLLFSIAWVAKLTTPLFSVFSQEFSGRDLVLLLGGLFLIYKAVVEIHASLEGEDEENLPKHKAATFMGVIAQIAVIDIIFSLDSVITAVGIADHISIMVMAIVLSMLVMVIASGTIASFISRHPTTKMLALAFLVMIGMTLAADGLHFHIPREYIYFAIAFSLGVEVLNLLAGRKRKT